MIAILTLAKMVSHGFLVGQSETNVAKYKSVCK